MNSNFVSLSSYCIAEYISTPLGSPSVNLLTSEYYLVENQHVNTRQIFNKDGYSDDTNNSRGLSVIGVGGSKVIYNDISKIPIYSEWDPLITETEVDPDLSTNLVMDTLRVHIAAGFNFTEVENFVIGIKHKLNDATQLQLASLLLNSETASSLFYYNPRPLFIANTVYDRYVDIKVPSVIYMDQDFDQFGSSSFEWAITGGIGFIKNAPLSVYIAEAVYEEYNASNDVTYDRYQLADYKEGAIPQINIFDGLGCHISEAADGDFIEFFGTWNGAFPDELIGILNDSGPDQEWIIAHQLTVYEHIGGDIIQTGNALIYQENDFDERLTYRPILKEAGFAVAMSIDYTMRLINKKNGDQVIKTGSMSLINPNKYGRRLQKIGLLDEPQSMKVYNKIVQKNFEAGTLFAPKSTHTQVSTSSASTTSGTSTVIQKVEVKIPEYLPIKQANIKVSSKNALHKVGKESDQIIYGQGRLVLPMDPVDNVFKFTVYETNPLDPKSQSRVNLNNNSEFRLTFGKTTDYVFSSLIDQTLTSPSRGEIAFRVPKEKAKNILQSDDSGFFISLVSKADGTETLLYAGTWIASSEYGTVLTAAEDAISALENENAVADLTKKLKDLTDQNEVLLAKIDELTRTKTQTQAQEVPQTVNSSAATAPPRSQPRATAVSTAPIRGGGGGGDDLTFNTTIKPNPNKPVTAQKIPYLNPPFDENPRILQTRPYL